MTASVILICHGSTAALRKAAFPDDEPLDRFGERDCARIVNPGTPDRIWVAPERRTLQTAEALGLQGEIAPALRDCDHGRWRGRSLETLAETEPEAIAAWLGDPDAAPHGGESHRAVEARVAAWLQTCADEGGRTIAVTHPTLIRAAIADAVGAGAEALRRIDVAPLFAAHLTHSGHTQSGHWRFRGLAPFGTEM